MDDYIIKPFRHEDIAQTIKTRLNKYEKLLQINDEKFKILLHKSPSGILVTDKNLKISYINQKLTELLKYNKEDLKDKKITDIIYHKDLDEFNKVIDICWGGREAELKTTSRFIKKNKDNIKLEFQAILVPYKNKKGLIISLDGKESQLIEADQSEAVPPVQLLNPISKREIEVLTLLAQGFTTDEIGEKLCISNRTVEGHRARLMTKTDTKNSVDLVVFALKNSLIKI